MDKKILDRYDSREGAASYEKKFKRHWTERINDSQERRLVHRLLKETLNGKPLGVVMDLPCGYGRLYPIVQEFAERVVEGDWSSHLLSLARERQREKTAGRNAPVYVRATALSLPFPDGAFDLTLSVRLCHHIREHSERIQYVKEILRVSRQWAVFTYFNRDSLKNRIREFRRRFNGKRSKWTLSASEIRALAREQGFEPVCDVPLSRLFSGHHYAMFRRR
jgi:SAM-dependent methyltransferase